MQAVTPDAHVRTIGPSREMPEETSNQVLLLILLGELDTHLISLRKLCFLGQRICVVALFINVVLLSVVYTSRNIFFSCTVKAVGKI